MYRDSARTARVEAVAMTNPERGLEPSEVASDARARGVVAALAAYLAWGIFPIYFKAVANIAPLLVLAHRVLWSMVFLALLVTVQRRWGSLAPELTLRRLGVYARTTLLISANWLIFIWAVGAGHALEASLGYFVNPLVNVILGALFLRERLTERQRIAVGLAALGVMALVVQLGTFPWISVALALTFGLYGLLRKRERIDAIMGLLVETALLAPVAALYIGATALRGPGAFGGSATGTLLLLGFGVITPVPLIWFAVAVRSLRLATMGLLQYIAPTCQFLIAVALFREPFTRAHAVAFACIWASLALYTWDALRQRRPEVAEPLALD
jgi:chloramphenicol-sensitive protein RarD